MVDCQAATEKRPPEKIASEHCRCIPATPFFSAAGANLVQIATQFLFYKLNSRFIE
jgi:hypothetical protein